MAQFSLSFGALALPLSEQLTKQGVPFDAKECDLWERWHDALNLLAVNGPVTHGERQKIQERMFKRIRQSLQAHIDSLAEVEAVA